MNTRMLVLATAALMLAAPLSGAQAGRLTELAKISVKVNGLLAKKALKGAASITKDTLLFNARVAKCAVDRTCGQ